jgi:pimeloyl-ACP methyl ester carboxylesterase
MKRIAIVLTTLIGLGALGFIMGPKPDFEEIEPSITPLDIPLHQLVDYIAKKEAQVEDLKPDNQARIIWADSLKSKTAFSVVYLHGFSASQEEGDPVHTAFASRYGFNLFLSRLADHGRADSTSFEHLTPKQLVDSAKEAISIGHLLGEKVIVMSCSTGGTLSAYLAAYNKDIIHSQIMMSPNIDIKDPMSAMLVYPWGFQMSRMSFGGEINAISYPEEARKYWNDAYHIKGLIALKHLINHTMTKEVFKEIAQPLFLGYYYEDEEHQDNVVSVARMHDFYNQITTPPVKKVMMPFPKAGRHVISSHIMSGDIDGLLQAVYEFGDGVLGFKPIVSMEVK